MMQSWLLNTNFSTFGRSRHSKPFDYYHISQPMVGQPGRSGGYRPGAGRKPTAARLSAGSGLAGGRATKTGGIGKTGGIASFFKPKQNEMVKEGGQDGSGAGNDGEDTQEQVQCGPARPKRVGCPKERR